jgi:hypothetical protein
VAMKPACWNRHITFSHTTLTAPSLAAFLFICIGAHAELVRSPFPQGYAMGNFGTIQWDQGLLSQQPWAPAAFSRDSARFGLSLCGVSFYDRMDNFSERLIYSAAAGVSMKLRKLALRVSYTRFSVLETYFEHSGFFSAGIPVFNSINVSIECTANRSGLYGEHGERRSFFGAGATLWVPWRLVCGSFSVANLPVEKAGVEGADALIALRAGVHTSYNRFGAQGVVVDIQPQLEKPVRLMIGEEIRLGRYLGIHAALSNNPVMIALGAVADIGTYGIGTSFVNHPVLGWSQGMTAAIVRR